MRAYHERHTLACQPHDYDRFESWQHDPHLRRWNLWSYVDPRDVAQAVRLGLEANLGGAEIAIIAASDTCMHRDSADLMAEGFPSVPLRRAVVGRETLLSIERARKLLGYDPRHSWLEAA